MQALYNIFIDKMNCNFNLVLVYSLLIYKCSRTNAHMCLHKTSKYFTYGIFFKCLKYHSTKIITLKVMTHGKEVTVDVLQIDTELEI